MMKACVRNRRGQCSHAVGWADHDELEVSLSRRTDQLQKIAPRTGDPLVQQGILTRGRQAINSHPTFECEGISRPEVQGSMIRNDDGVIRTVETEGLSCLAQRE